MNEDEDLSEQEFMNMTRDLKDLFEEYAETLDEETMTFSHPTTQRAETEQVFRNFFDWLDDQHG